MVTFLPLGVIHPDVMPRTGEAILLPGDEAIQGKRPEAQETREAEAIPAHLNMCNICHICSLP